MDNTTDATDSKTGRRASFARVLHVPSSIARRVKQPEQLGLIKKGPSSRSQSVDPKSPRSTTFTREVHLSDNDDGGEGGGGGAADIPNIALRRSPNMRSINSEMDSANATSLEKILASGDSRNTLSPPPPPPQQQLMGTISLASARLRAEKRYEGQCDSPSSLYPISERSWDFSLNSVPEPVTSPDPEQQWVELPAASSLGHHGHSTSSQSLSTTTYAQTERSFTNNLLQKKMSATDEDSDPNNFDLVIPTATTNLYNLERRSELLFSAEHLRVIFSDPVFLHRFASFVATYRPQSMQLLNYTLDALKAIRAMEYTNHIISHSLRSATQDQHSSPTSHAPPHFHRQILRDFNSLPGPDLMVNESLLQKTAAAFQTLARDELPAYVTHVWADIMEQSMKKRITATMPAKFQDSFDSPADIFVVSDPSRQDNPIVFASDDFHRTTHYGPDYVFGRNCRFLQGPKTNPYSLQRLREMVNQGKEHYETLLNYRRDGLPFMNLLMCSPLLDSMGNVRYYLGAQIDVSHLAKDCSGLESLRRLVDQDQEDQRRRQEQEDDHSETDFDPSSVSPGTARTTASSHNHSPRSNQKKGDEFRLLAEMFTRTELDTVRRHGGRMHHRFSQHEHMQEQPSYWHKPRVLLDDSHDSSSITTTASRQQQTVTDANGNISLTARSPPPPVSSPFHLPSSAALHHQQQQQQPSPPHPPAIFENYLVVRPYPSLRILFASPSLRVPGTLQSHLMSRIGGSRRIHEELEYAFAMGEGVTAKVKWVSGSGLRSTSAVPGGEKSGSAVGSGAALPDNMSGSTNNSGSASASASLGSPETIGMEGRLRWIQCTPLLGADGDVGVWVVIITDDDGTMGVEAAARARRQSEPSLGMRPQQQMGSAGPETSRPDKRGSSNGGEEEVWSLADYAALNRLPEDEDLRRHVRKMYEETRRRERTDAGHEWEKGWKKGDGGVSAANQPAPEIEAAAAVAATSRSRVQSPSVSTNATVTDDSITTANSSARSTTNTNNKKKPGLLQI